MAEVDQLEVFKIGRTRIVFPPDITEDELQFLSVIIFSYIQATRFKTSGNSIKPWRIADRLEEKKKQAGVS